MVNLYFVPTPIGSYEDMTIRGVEVLKSCDEIYIESIESKELLSYYNIDKPLYCYKDNKKEILDKIDKGLVIGVISKEGYSGIDIETHSLLKEAISKNKEVVVLPGANYLLTGLVTSGIPCDKFMYLGNVSNDINKYIDYDKTLVFFSDNDSINKDINNLTNVLGKRECVIVLNASCNNETFIRFNLGDEIDIPSTNKKIVIVIEGAKIKSEIKMLNDLTIEEHYNYYLSQGLDNKEAMKKVAKDRGVSKSDIYKVINC